MTPKQPAPDDVIDSEATDFDDVTDSPSADLALKPAPLMAIMPTASVSMMTERRNTILQIQREVMIDGVHYGAPFGKKDKNGKIEGKPTLLKPGAELLCATFGLFPDFEDLETPNLGLIFATSPDTVPFFMYRYRCILETRDKRYQVGSGIGSCNSYEKKYRYRSGQLICPECLTAAVNKSKKADQPGFYCWDKLGGCGAKFRPDDPQIITQEVGQVDNPDIAEVINTIDKMAQKRALVAATLIAVGASEVFTQDMEDIHPAVEPHWTEKPAWVAKAYELAKDTYHLTRDETHLAAGIKQGGLKKFRESPEALKLCFAAYAAAKSAAMGFHPEDQMAEDIEEDDRWDHGRAPLDGEEARDNFVG